MTTVRTLTRDANASNRKTPMTKNRHFSPATAEILIFYERGFSFFSFHRARRPTPETLTTLNRTPGISHFALPLRPKPARRTSSFSSTKFKQPSLGTRNKIRVSNTILIIKSTCMHNKNCASYIKFWQRNRGIVCMRGREVKSYRKR